MKDTLILEWTFTPTDYFESDITEDLGTFRLEIANGKVRATFGDDADIPSLEDIHNQVRAFFDGVQFASHKPFELSKYTLFRQHSDGTSNITVFPDSCALELRTGTIDILITDAEGNVIKDSRVDRRTEHLEFAKLSAKHSSSDATVRGMISSYASSVNDPANELVHLYEIRDALKKEFGDDKTAQSTLSISKKDWKRLGELSNHEPLKQGRHRGQKIGALRDATVEELAEARRIARQMVLAYLKYID
jgi:hypothetical protein